MRLHRRSSYIHEGVLLLKQFDKLDAGVRENVQLEIDELIIDCLGADATRAANEQEKPDAQEVAIATAEGDASRINDEGFAGQIAMILAYYGLEEGKNRLSRAANIT